MKVTIDTDCKIIEIEQCVNVAELIEWLKTILGKEWKEYSIQQKYIPYNFPLVTYGNGIALSPGQVVYY